MAGSCIVSQALIDTIESRAVDLSKNLALERGSIAANRRKAAATETSPSPLPSFFSTPATAVQSGASIPQKLEKGKGGKKGKGGGKKGGWQYDDDDEVESTTPPPPSTTKASSAAAAKQTPSSKSRQKGGQTAATPPPSGGADGRTAPLGLSLSMVEEWVQAVRPDMEDAGCGGGDEGEENQGLIRSIAKKVFPRCLIAYEEGLKSILTAGAEVRAVSHPPSHHSPSPHRLASPLSLFHLHPFPLGPN